MRCWRGYMSGARCKWFAYGPADATGTLSSLASLKSRLVWPFWCWLTQVVLEKMSLNGFNDIFCLSVCPSFNKNTTTTCIYQPRFLCAHRFPLGFLPPFVKKENLCGTGYTSDAISVHHSTLVNLAEGTTNIFYHAIVFLSVSHRCSFVLLPCDGTLAWYMPSSCSCLSQVRILLKRLNVGSRKQRHTIAQRFQFLDAEDLAKTQTESPQRRRQMQVA